MCRLGLALRRLSYSGRCAAACATSVGYTNTDYGGGALYADTTGDKDTANGEPPTDRALREQGERLRKAFPWLGWTNVAGPVICDHNIWRAATACSSGSTARTPSLKLRGFKIWHLAAATTPDDICGGEADTRSRRHRRRLASQTGANL